MTSHLALATIPTLSLFSNMMRTYVAMLSTQTNTLSHTHSHTHSHAHTLSLALSRSLRLPLCFLFYFYVCFSSTKFSTAIMHTFLVAKKILQVNDFRHTLPILIYCYLYEDKKMFSMLYYHIMATTVYLCASVHDLCCLIFALNMDLTPACSLEDHCAMDFARHCSHFTSHQD